MKNLLVFGYGHKSTAAVSKILFNLFKLMTEINSAISVTLFGYGKSNSTKIISDRFRIISIKDPFSKGTVSPYRFIRKFNYVFKIDQPCLSNGHILKKANKLFIDESFDYVIGASGYYMYTEAAYNFAKDRNINFGMMMFDPFTNNIRAKNKNKRIKLEQKWYDYSSFILREEGSIESPISDSKKVISSFDIPMFNHEVNFNKSGPIVYGGNIYSGFRGIEPLLELINRDSFKDESFEIYSNINHDDLKNAKFHPLVDLDEFERVCLNAKAILVIGNGEHTNTIPSKVYDAISYKKPIIGVNFLDLNSDIKKYPLYFDGEDCLESINSLTEKDLSNIDLYSLFPNRNPNILISKLIEKISK